MTGEDLDKTKNKQKTQLNDRSGILEVIPGEIGSIAVIVV